MTTQPISIRRILSALLLCFGASAVLGGTFVIGRERGRFDERRSAWAREIQSGSWRPASVMFAGLDAAGAWGIQDQQDGNALSLYWPDGVSNAPSPCRRTYPAGFDGPVWASNNPNLAWREAAACERVDEIVRAAHFARLDMSEWLRSVGPEALPGEQFWIDLQSGPLRDIAALIARAHLRIEEGDLTRGEADARAAVSASLHFMRGAADLISMEFSGRALLGALDHMREIRERQGDAVAVTRIAEVTRTVGEVTRGLNRFATTAPKAGGFPSTLHDLVRISTNRTNPLGMRTYAAMVLGYAWVYNPQEAWLGPSAERREAMAVLERQPELTAAVGRARKGLELPLRQRLSVLESATAY
jgi:hypothetical protein